MLIAIIAVAFGLTSQAELWIQNTVGTDEDEAIKQLAHDIFMDVCVYIEGGSVADCHASFEEHVANAEAAALAQGHAKWWWSALSTLLPLAEPIYNTIMSW